jgi:hydroxypyruvate isomerase
VPRFAANLSMLCTEHAFLDRFAAAGLFALIDRLGWDGWIGCRAYRPRGATTAGLGRMEAFTS